MDRRAFICGLAFQALSAPLVAEAQQRLIPRIGILTGESSSDLLPALSQFRRELHKLGWIDGQTIIVLDPRATRDAHQPHALVVCTAAEITAESVFKAKKASRSSSNRSGLNLWPVGEDKATLLTLRRLKGRDRRSDACALNRPELQRPGYYKSDISDCRR